MRAQAALNFFWRLVLASPLVLALALPAAAQVGSRAPNSEAPERQFLPPPGFVGSDNVLAPGLSFAPAEDVFGLTDGLLPTVALTPASPYRSANWARPVDAATRQTSAYGTDAIYTAIPPLVVTLPGAVFSRDVHIPQKHPIGSSIARDAACVSLTREYRTVSTYWNTTATAAAENGPTSASATTDLAPEGLGPEAEEWCTPPAPASWLTEPFTITFWGPVLILGFGFVAFWAVRGFRSP